MKRRRAVLSVAILIFTFTACEKENTLAPESETIYQAEIWSALQGGIVSRIVAGTPVYRWMTFINTTWDDYTYPASGALDTLMLGNNRYGVLTVTPAGSNNFNFDLHLTGEPGMQAAIIISVEQDSMRYSPIDYSDAGDMRMQFGVRMIGTEQDL